MSKKGKKHITPEFNFIPEDLVSYKCVDCLYELCSADNILTRIKYDSYIMFKYIRQGILDLDLAYVNHKNCMCNLGQGKRPYVNKVTCVGCELLRRVMTSVKLPEDKTIKIQIGKYEGKILSIEDFDEDFTKYNVNLDIQDIFNKYMFLEYNHSLMEDSNYNIHRKTKIYSTSSPITNYVLTSIFINNKMIKYKIPNTILLEWVYSCNEKIKLVKSSHYKFKDLYKLDLVNKHNRTPTAQSRTLPLKDNVVISILKKLIVILHFYSKYSFVHGRPCLEYLNFTNKQCNYKYGDINIDSPITLHVEPSYYTSFTYETDSGANMRLINTKDIISSDVYDTYPIKSSDIMINYRPKTVPDNYQIPMIQELRNHLIYCYKIDNKLNEFINLQINYGIPLSQGSFECYCFLISLMFEDSFYISFMNNERLQGIWYSLWMNSDYENVNRELEELKTQDRMTHEDITSFVSKYYLRSDIIKHLYECMLTI